MQSSLQECLQMAIKEKELSQIQEGKQKQILELDLGSKPKYAGYSGLRCCCDFCELTHLRQLKLNCNSIKDINGLLLPSQLVYLSLGGNRLQSIEALVQLNLAGLKTLKLYSNLMISVKSLRKCEWPSIEEICLQDNQHVRDMETVAMFPKKGHRKSTTVQIMVEDQPDPFLKKILDKIIPKCHPRKLILT